MNHEDLTTKHAQKADELSLLDRVVLILEQARANVVRSVKRSLERQIHSQYYERMLVSQNPQQMIESARREMAPRTEGIETLKNPYVRGVP